MKYIRIEDEVFKLFPEFYRAIVIVSDLTNHASSEAISELLAQETARRGGADVSTDPGVLAWDEAHKKFGSAPGKYPPSIKALLKRIRSNPSLPFINSVVALFNYISIKYCLPCGGDDVDAIAGDLVLGLADGSETFAPLGGGNLEAPFPGEVIYYDSANKNIMCRRWNWRNGDSTKIGLDTKRLVINLDCLPPLSPEIGNRARDELAGLLREHCRADVQADALHRERRQIEVFLKDI